MYTYFSFYFSVMHSCVCPIAKNVRVHYRCAFNINFVETFHECRDQCKTPLSDLLQHEHFPHRIGQSWGTGTEEDLPYHHQGLSSVFCCGVPGQTGNPSDGTRGWDSQQPECPISSGFLPWGGADKENKSWIAGIDLKLRMSVGAFLWSGTMYQYNSNQCKYFKFNFTKDTSLNRHCVFSARPSRFLRTL